MRIQNNITAMNTHRQYTINNENVAKNAEKLSSGYRINRAGDDAAGLAISEKMRSQIRGLNMATKNSQDAISLVQTAEGALQETQNMLQRMNELAVQSATGTNEDLDRDALAKEFEQLKREINDVAEQTTFNNMKILDGSKSYEGAVRSALTAGVTKTEAEWTDGVKAADPLTPTMVTASVKGQDAQPEVKGTLTVSGGTGDLLNKVSTDTGATYKITIADADGNDLTMTNNTVTIGAGNDKSVASLLTATGNEITFSKDGATFKGSVVDGKLVFTDTATDGAVTDIDLQDLKVTIVETPSTPGTVVNGTAAINAGTANSPTDKPSITYSGLNATSEAGAVYQVNIGAGAADSGGTGTASAAQTITVIGDGTKKVGELIAEKAGAVTLANAADDDVVSMTASWDATGGNLVFTGPQGPKSDTTGAPAISYTKLAGGELTAKGKDSAAEVAAQPPVQGETKFELDNDKLNVGDTIKIGGEVFKIGDGDGEVAKGDTAQETVANLVTAVQAKLGTDATKSVTITDNLDGSFNVKQGLDGDKLIGKDTATFKAGDGATTKTTIEFDVAKLKAGDKITFKIGDDDFELEVTEDMVGDREAMLAALDDAIADMGDGVERKGNAIIVKGKNVTEATLTWPKEEEEANAMRIQVGALENEQLNISIDSMNTAGLSLDTHRIDDQDAAGRAITAVRSAINQVSTQRATLGAMQNRLDHKIANLKVTTENLSAAESRIRDVDMASEMTSFTKNNILSQAATAMLAQANALPQNVLSLLG